MITRKKSDIHTISVLVANKPGVLVRCAQIFARRAYNIDALVVSPAMNEKYSRMTITAQGDPATLDQIIKQTTKLVDVLHCSEHTGEDSVDREYAMIKVKSSAKTKANIKKLLKNKAHVLDEGKDAIIIGQSGDTEQLDAVEDSLKKYGLIEVVRSGKLVIAKGLEAT